MKLGSIIQTVHYTPYPSNPKAAELMIANAKPILGVIEGTQLLIGRALESPRTVVRSNGKVLKTTIWESKEAMEYYFGHPNIRTWCEFVLNGWMLEGSTSGDPKAEFIDHILSGREDKKWMINPAVSADAIVWGGEEIDIHTVEELTL